MSCVHFSNKSMYGSVRDAVKAAVRYRRLWADETITPYGCGRHWHIGHRTGKEYSLAGLARRYK